MSRFLAIVLLASVAAGCGGVSGSVAPHSALAGAAIAYDSAAEHVVAFGGAPFIDHCGQPGVGSPTSTTYVWDGRWREIHPSVSPPARTRAVAGFAPSIGGVILLGGNYTPVAPCPHDGIGIAYPERFRTDAWAWDGVNWSPLNGASVPHDLTGLGTDTPGATLIGVGAAEPVTPGSPAGTWVFGRPADGHAWELSSRTQPERPGGSLAYDPSTSHVLAFSGSAPFHSIEVSGKGWADTWLWDGTTWTRPVLAHEPDAAVGTVATETRGRGVLLFNALGQTWLWRNGMWTRLHPSTSPPSDFKFMTMVDDAARHVDLLVMTDPHHDDQTWLWDGQDWKRPF